MIGLASTSFDVDGALILKDAGRRSSLYGRARRVTRTKTLDGNAVLTDAGYSDADRTLNITQPSLTDAELATLEYLIETYTTVVVSTRDGCFLGAIATLSLLRGELQMSVLVSSKLSA